MFFCHPHGHPQPQKSGHPPQSGHLKIVVTPWSPPTQTLVCGSKSQLNFVKFLYKYYTNILFLSFLLYSCINVSIILVCLEFSFLRQWAQRHVLAFSFSLALSVSFSLALSWLWLLRFAGVTSSCFRGFLFAFMSFVLSDDLVSRFSRAPNVSCFLDFFAFFFMYCDSGFF